MNGNVEAQIQEREYLLDRVKGLLISSLKLDTQKDYLDPDTPLFGTGLGLDSIDAVVIVVDMETQFGVTLDEDDNVMALRTINTLVDEVLKKKRNEAGYQI